MGEEGQGKAPAGEFVGLLGEPTGESLSRKRVDNLGFSTVHNRRPSGQSRDDYLKGDPGRMTGRFMREAGLTRRRRRGVAAAVLAMALMVGLLTGMWWLASH